MGLTLRSYDRQVVEGGLIDASQSPLHEEVGFFLWESWWYRGEIG